MLTPRYGLLILSPLINALATSKAVSIGIANPIPSIVELAIFILVIPITSPFILQRGPPLFPAFIAASVCNTSITLSLVSTVLFLPLNIPLVTLHEYTVESSGAPTANVVSPTLILSLLPVSAVITTLLTGTDKTAISE